MPTRRQFLATSAAAAFSASALPGGPRPEAPPSPPETADERDPAARRLDDELRRRITRAAFAQSVPAPAG